MFLPEGPVPQHGPHHPHQIVGRRHQGDFLPLRIRTLGALEVSPDGRRPAQRLPGRLGQQLADDGRALAGDVPEPVAAAGLVRARHQAEVAADGLGVGKALRVIEERSDRLDVKDFDRWLDPAVQEPKKLEPLLVPSAGDKLKAYPISTEVNSPRNQGAKCIEPAAQ